MNLCKNIINDDNQYVKVFPGGGAFEMLCYLILSKKSIDMKVIIYNSNKKGC
jgi:hypothetical protein